MRPTGGENQGQWEDASIRFAMNAMGANAGLLPQLAARKGLMTTAIARRTEEQFNKILLLLVLAACSDEWYKDMHKVWDGVGATPRRPGKDREGERNHCGG